MVFESILVDLLNKYLGDYVQDLDRSQLKIGIWGGNVVLEDLYLKPNVLDDLDLPVKTVFGQIGKLVLKIPWKNLYSAPVVATVERLFLVAVPNHDCSGDFLRNVVKQAELHKLELAKQEKGKTKSADTFSEKVATQIIRNIQVKILDIHIRYEDCVTTPERPFSVGITLHNLSVHTGDENWRECVDKEKDMASIIYKLLVLEGLAIYWNCDSEMFSQRKSHAELRKVFQDGIHTKDRPSKGYVYMLGPINSSARLQLNPRPEDSGYTVPKVLLTLMMERLAVGITKDQYHSLLELLEFFNRSSQLAAYRKIRPNVPYKGHYRKWWRFVTTCILNQQGHHRFRLDWNSVANHRIMCQTYATMYRMKLKDQKQLSAEVQRVLNDCEDNLDIFNIRLVRQQVEAEVEWLDQRNQQESKAQQSWFGGLFNRKSQKKQESLTEMLKDKMSSEERLRLYQAIDYREDASPAQYPTNYVETRVTFLLNSLTMEVTDGSYGNSPQVLLAELTGVASRVELRPAASAIKLVAKMKQFTVYGSRSNGSTPQVISSRTLKDESYLLDVMFETTPMDGACDQRLRMFALPLQLVYDARTVNRVMDVFRAPRSNVLTQLQAIAESRLTALRGISASGLQYAIEQHTVTDIEVDLKSSYVLVPHRGCYRGNEDVLVVNLGRLSVTTLPREQQKSEGGATGESYDRFIVELRDVQVLVALKGEAWAETLGQQQESPLHLLQPTALNMRVDKRLGKVEPSVPKLKMLGKVAAVAVNIEEKRFIHLMALFHSIVFPNSNESDRDVLHTPSVSVNNHFLDSTDKMDVTGDGQDEVQFSNIELKFEMGGLMVSMYRPVILSGVIELQKILDFRAMRLGINLVMKPTDVSVAARLGGVMLLYNGPEGCLRLMEPAGTAGDMLTVKYTSVYKKSPQMHGRRVDQLLQADFTRLGVLLHKEAMITLLEYIRTINARLEVAKQCTGRDVYRSPSTVRLRKANSIWQHTNIKPSKLKFKAVMHELKLCLHSGQQPLLNMVVEGLEAWGFVKQHSMGFITKLKDVKVLDVNSKTPHQNILSIVGDEALSAEVVMYNRRKGVSKHKVDMSLKVKMARSRIIFLNSFFITILEFLEIFQGTQEDLALAMAGAAEAARHTMLEAHAKSKWVQLEVDMQAPLIVVPVHSTSLDAFHMDFGKLTIRNTMVTLDPVEKGKSPVVDVIQLGLEDLKLSRVTLGSKGEVLSEHRLLKPVSFQLKLKRNLSLDWYRDMPDIVMQGCLETAQLALSQDDVQTMMRVLSQNLLHTTTTHRRSVAVPSKKLEVERLSVEKTSTDGPISWDLNLCMCTLKADLSVRRSRETLAHFAVTGLDVTISQRVSSLRVGFRLKNITVLNPSPHTIHQRVLAIEGEEALSAEVAVFDRSSEKLVGGSDMSVRAQMACIRVVYLGAFFSAMMEFLDAFQEAHADIAVAVAGAAEAAKQGVLKAHAKAKRISLDLDLKAPLIIVPVDSSSTHALLLDYGNLTIKNSFIEEVDKETRRVAILDKLLLGLQNLKVSRVQLGSHGEILMERWLLQPVNFLLRVKRNLCCDWYKAVPDVDVQGHLNSVMVAGNQEDIQVALRVLLQNVDIAEERQQDQGSEKSTMNRSQRSPSPSPAVRSIPVKFSFTLDSLVVELFDETPKLLELSTDLAHSPEDSLARFTLRTLEVQGLLSSDGGMNTTLLLVDCWLDDTRHGRKARLTRLMERKSEPTGSMDSVMTRTQLPKNVEVTYKKRGLLTDVDIRIFSFNLVLNVEYLTKLGQFLSSTLQIVQKPLSTSLKTSSSMILMATPNPSQTASTTTIIHLHAEKPDIFLVETMEDIDTSALVLRSEISCTVRVDAVMQVKGTIKELQLYSCCYNPERRKDTLSQILQPCSMQVEGSLTQMDVRMTDVRLRVSPGTIELLNRVARALYVRGNGEGSRNDTDLDLSRLWQHKPFQDSDHWFLKNIDSGDTRKGVVLSVEKHTSQPAAVKEICLILCPSITVTVEAGVGSHTVPMVLLTGSLQGSLHNWNSELYMDSTLSLQMAYYNSCLALWEPLIEPVEKECKGRMMHVPWELNVMVQLKQPPKDSYIDQIRGDFEVVPREISSTTDINIFSNDNLEVTLTKTCLDVLTDLTKAFHDAIDGAAIDAGQAAWVGPTAPYVVWNRTGLHIVLQLQSGPFKLYCSGGGKDTYNLEPGASVALGVDDSCNMSPVVLMARGQSVERLLRILVSSQTLIMERWCHFKHENNKSCCHHGVRVCGKQNKKKVRPLDCILDLPVVQANQRFFPLHGSCGVVSAVKVQDGCTTVTLRSVVQVYNHLGAPLDIYYKESRGPDLTYVGTVSPADHMDLPLHAVYTPNNELLLRVPGYSTIPYQWMANSDGADTKLFECNPERRTTSEGPCFLWITKQSENVYYKTMQMLTATCYRVHVRPAVVVKNLLPIRLVCHQSAMAISHNLEPGERAQMATVKPGVSRILFHIPEYNQKQWDCLHTVDQNCQEFIVLQFSSDQSMFMKLGLHTLRRNGCMVMSLYCPFWMLNKTEIHLSYGPFKSEDIFNHPGSSRSPLLLSSFRDQNKVAIRVGGSRGVWSDHFSLDVVGSSGVVTCRAGNYSYKIGVHIHLMRATLVKQVTFTPYFVLINNSRNLVQCLDLDRADNCWVKVEPGSCSPLWPVKHDDTIKLQARVGGSREATAAFPCNSVHTTLLRLKNKYGGLNVDVQITEGAVYITFSSYEPGQAPVLLINNSGMAVPITEKGVDSIWFLSPKQQALFTWSNPSKLCELEWAPGTDVEMCKLCKDGSGSFSPEPGTVVYWCSFLDGLQRVLLFSSGETAVQSPFDNTHVQQKLTVAIQGLGLSLINDQTCIELLYVSISRKPAKPKEKHIKASLHSISSQHSSTVGLWVEVKLLAHELQLHARVEHLQADNQLANCSYPVALAPVPPPRSVVACVEKPFAELSVVRRSMHHSPLQQFKYLMLLVQEFHVKLDIGLVSSLVAMLEAGQLLDDVEAAHFQEDRKLTMAPLLAHATLHSSEGQKNFFEFLHFSPLKIHLSFSLASSHLRSGQQPPHALHVLLRSLGVTLTDVQDVVFKLGYFERRSTFLTHRQMASEAMLHYRSQALKQLYVLVLGLDVLGNPYGLVLGLKQGVEDLFYEPFQGAIQGPGEFAEGLVLGMRSLLGHTVGGAAGAISRITGAMGKGVAALTFDKEYQRKRQETLSQRPVNVQTGLAQSSKGLVMGMVDGVSGVFMKPISGAKKEGVEGFFKGVGKGVVGLVARPTAGIIDFASGSLDAVKRTTDTTVEVARQRPTRFFHRDGLVRPYNRKEAEGNKLLQELENKQFATSDTYEFHVPMEPNGKEILLVTNKRVMLLNRMEIFDRWKVDWEQAWNTLSGPPTILQEGFYLPTEKTSRKAMGLLGSSSAGRVVIMRNNEQKMWIVEKLKVLMQ